MTHFPVFIQIAPHPPLGVDLNVNAVVADVIAEVVPDECLHKYYSIRIGDECHTNNETPLSDTNATAEVTIVVHIDSEKIDAIVECYCNKTYKKYISPVDHSYSNCPYGCPILCVAMEGYDEVEIKFIIMHVAPGKFGRRALEYLIKCGHHESAELFAEEFLPDEYGAVEILVQCLENIGVETWFKCLKSLILKNVGCHRVPRGYDKVEDIYYPCCYDNSPYKLDLGKIRERMIPLGITAEQFDNAFKHEESE